MNQSSGDWLLTALGAVFIVALIALLVALAYGLSGDGDDAPDTVRVVTIHPTPTSTPVGQDQAYLDSLEASRNLARVEAILHPSTPKGGAAALKPLTTASPTPIPAPIGVSCSSEMLTGKHYGENGYTGGILALALSIANIGDIACDLPPIVSIEGIDEGGAVVFSKAVTSTGICNDVHCVAVVPLPLESRGVAVDSSTRPPKPGTVVVGLEYGSRCPEFPKPGTPPCQVISIQTLVLNFEGGVSVPIDYSRFATFRPMVANDGMYITMVALIGRSIWDGWDTTPTPH